MSPTTAQRAYSTTAAQPASEQAAILELSIGMVLREMARFGTDATGMVLSRERYLETFGPYEPPAGT